MANESATVDVRMPSGKVWHIPRENLIRAKSLGGIEMTAAAQPETGKFAREHPLLSTFEEKTAEGMGLDVGKIQRLGGGSTKMQMMEATRQFLKGTGKWMDETIKDPVHLADPIIGVTTGLDEGLKGVYDLIRSGQYKDPQKRVASLGKLTGALGQTALGMDEGSVVKDIAKAPIDVIKGAKEGVRPAIRSTLGVSKQVIDKAETTAEAAAAKKLNDYADKKKIYDQKVADAEADHVKKMADKQAQHEVDVQAAKDLHQEKLEAAERSLSGKVTREAHARLKENRLNQATEKLTATRDQLVKQAAENMDSAEKAEKAQLDSRYEDFRQKVLGVSPETPNGTLQAQLSPIGEAIQHAKSSVMKGSRTNVTIFNDITGRMKDMVELPDGSLKPLEGQMITADQLRGYYKELGDAIYEKELPGDVRRALEYVRDNINHEIERAIEDTSGKKALDVYHKLSEDYSGYKRVWYDRNSGSPLPRILKTMRAPVALHEGVNMEGQIADLLSRKHAGEGITTLLAKKSQFGAKPQLVANLMAVSKKLGQLPDLYETIPVAKYPRFPGEFKAEEAPKNEPFKNTRDEPDKPDTEPFNRQGFIRDKVRQRIQTAGNYGMGFTALSGLTDLLHGNVAGTLSMAERIAVMQAIKTFLAKDKSVNWISKEGQ